MEAIFSSQRFESYDLEDFVFFVAVQEDGGHSPSINTWKQQKEHFVPEAKVKSEVWEGIMWTIMANISGLLDS